MKKNMLKLIHNVSALMMLMVALVLASCSKSKDDYCNVIPEDAVLVARLAPEELLDQNDLSISKLLDEFKMTKKERESIEEFLDCGLDFESPIYFFVDREMNVGIVLKMDDADDFEKNLKKQKATFKEYDNIKYDKLDSESFVCFDQNKLMFYRFNNNRVKKETVAKLMDQDASKSILDTKLYEELIEADKPVAVNFSYTDLLKAATKLNSMDADMAGLGMMAAMMPECHCLVSMDVKDESAKICTDIKPVSSTDEKRMADMLAYMGSIKGDLIDKGLDNPLGWMCFHLAGEKMLEGLSNIPMLESVIKEVSEEIDLDDILNSIEGDVSLAIGNDLSKDEPQLLMLAAPAGDDFMTLIKQYGPQMNGGVKVKPQGKDCYTIQQEKIQWDFSDFDESGDFASTSEWKDVATLGMKDKLFYITNIDRYKSGKVGTTTSLESHAKKAKGCQVYGFLDLQQTIEVLAAKTADPDDIPEHLNDLEVMTVWSKDFHAEMELKNQNGKNMAKTMLELMKMVYFSR